MKKKKKRFFLNSGLLLLLLIFEEQKKKRRMFYVKGSTFLSSLSSNPPDRLQENNNNNNNNNNDTGEQRNDNSENGLTSSAGIIYYYYDKHATKAVESLPFCIIGASILCMLSVLYTTFLIPAVLRTTALSYADSNGLPGNDNNSNGRGYAVPLEIGCTPLSPRTDGGAKSVKDLRVDDIKVVIGIGDR